jgi:hypothetical protein
MANIECSKPLLTFDISYCHPLFPLFLQKLPLLSGFLSYFPLLLQIALFTL